MQGRRPGEQQSKSSNFGIDPTQTSFTSSFPQTGGTDPHRGGAPLGGGGGSQQILPPQAGQSFYPHLAGYIDNRFLAGSGYTGFPSANLKQGRTTGGLIGQLSTASASAAGTTPALGYDDRRLGQQVAKLRLAGNSGSSANGAGLNAGQLALAGRDYGSQVPYYGPRTVGQIPSIGQYSSGATQDFVTHGRHAPAYGGGSFVGPRSNSVPPAIGGPPIGQVGGQSQHTVGQIQGSVGSVGPNLSPFVPASTSHPITGGAAAFYPQSIHGEKSGSAESVQRGHSDSTSGGLSNMGSISNLGSISQMGSIGISNIPPPATAHTTSRSTSSLPNKVKAVCSSGGHFVKLSGGGLEYQGGETRLIAIPNFCRFSELSEALERIAGNAAGMSSASSEQSPSIKYQLPSEPHVYVDLVDDEDTQLMFDEWQEYTTSAHRSAAAKLHLFVDWHRRQPLSEASLQKGHLRNLGGSSESMELAPASHSQEQVHSAGSAEERSSQPNSAETAGTPGSQQPKFDYHDIAERMEVIQPKDVSLAKFLGSGGYGEVYLGKWHSSEAAIKCLNPSLFYNEGQVSQAAITELIREADLLGSLRHPNVVWVYGIVLPKIRVKNADETSSEDSSETDNIPTSSQPAKPGVPGAVRPPAIVTEFMSQGSLKGALQRKADIVHGALMRVLIAMDAAKGMEYLHSKRIVHFDLKSANLLLGYRDRRAICKVADFGLSKQKKETYVTGVSSQRGTLPWIAPEIIKSPTTVNEKVDVYSFGVVLWELWTGKEPYDGLNYHALLHQITSSDAIVRPALPGSPDWDPEVGLEPAPGYRALMERCWNESPAGRPSFSDIVKVLKDMASALRPVKRPRPPTSGATSSNASQRVREVTAAEPAVATQPPPELQRPAASLASSTEPSTAADSTPQAAEPERVETGPGRADVGKLQSPPDAEASGAGSKPPTQPLVSAFNAVQQAAAPGRKSGEQ